MSTTFVLDMSPRGKVRVKGPANAGANANPAPRNGLKPMASELCCIGQQLSRLGEDILSEPIPDFLLEALFKCE